MHHISNHTCLQNTGDDSLGTHNRLSDRHRDFGIHKVLTVGVRNPNRRSIRAARAKLPGVAFQFIEQGWDAALFIFRCGLEPDGWSVKFSI